MLSTYKQISLCCCPDKSVNAGRRERESYKRGVGVGNPRGGSAQKLREAGFCGWLIGRVERIKFFAEQRGKKNVKNGMGRRRKEEEE